MKINILEIKKRENTVFWQDGHLSLSIHQPCGILWLCQGWGKWCLADINCHGEARAEHLWLGRCGREELGLWSCSGWVPADSVLAGRWLLLSVKHCRLKCLFKVLWSWGCVQENKGRGSPCLPKAGAVPCEVAAAGAVWEGVGPARDSVRAPELPGAVALWGAGVWHPGMTAQTFPAREMCWQDSSSDPAREHKVPAITAASCRAREPVLHGPSQPKCALSAV